MPPPSPRKILKVETKICAVWGILEANSKKSSTLKFIMNFLTLICIHRSIILIFIGKKVCLSIFFQWKIFFPRFSIFISARILVSATKLANIKIKWSRSKLETKCWFTGPYRIVSWHQEQKAWPDTSTFWMQSLTHISDSWILPNTNQCLLSLSDISKTSICFSPMRRFLTQVLSRLLQVRHERMRFTTRWWAAFRVKSFTRLSLICKFTDHCWYAYKMATNPSTIPKRLTCKWRLGYFPSL